MKRVAEQLSQALHVRGAPELDTVDRLVGGPISLLHRSNPLMDDLGNLLPEALPPAPVASALWEPLQGPLEDGEILVGPIRVRVRPRADAQPTDC